MPIRITALTDPDRTASGYRLAWLASGDDGEPLGSAFLRMFTREGQEHLAELQLNVHTAERRKRVGSRLLETVVAAARAEGRRSVIAQADAGTPGDHFLAARGFRRVLTLTYARLALDELDTGKADEINALVEQPHPGYRLASWRGTVPEELAKTFADSRRAMDDMPMDDTDYGVVAWDVERVLAAAKAIADRGELLTTVVAVDESDSSIVGFSELVVPGDGKGEGQHYGTGVLPEHRGHGLGRWMKAEMIRVARANHPELAGLITDTANSNTHMRRINDALGYVPTHQALEYQLNL
ncbi:GNAT family N-acetyltransferase [Streptomyces cyaneochromogenes]|uniref:GNAT family N-acetyltransferase n=1 Tax=Streptomyces cyaneochromogenes TaxID=2496836 RepID=A0A3Q9ENE4_9ACTN|nr:GNAT family N-acetyltransferase [Streptomyces cyaneochromogenes]AZQ32301.1 GNAT family N-acetyltransferase [Streptomyces cyaneochromogenes]